MKDMEIDRVRVYAVGPEIPRYAWASDMPEQYMTNNIVRITTRGGLEGIAGAIVFTDFGYTSAIAETIRRMVPFTIGETPFERETLWGRMLKYDFPTAPQALSVIDTALWDLTAKHAGLPLYQMLGGSRSRAPSYASLVMLDSAEAYVDYIAELREEGFRAFKLHCWCEVERDIAMAEAVRAHHDDPGLRFMLDSEMRYSREDALRAARALEALDFEWLEAPFWDTDLEGYRELNRRTDLRIIPAGNWILAPQLLDHALRTGCWSSARFDVTVAGGFTQSNKLMGVAAAHGAKVEVQCWGYTLTHAANLHLILANENAGYFEQPVEYGPYEFGAIDVIRTDAQGYVHAPDGPGLGVRMDWEAIEAASFLTYEVTGKD